MGLDYLAANSLQVCISCNFHNLHGSYCYLFLDLKEKRCKVGFDPGFLIHDSTMDTAVSNVISGPLIFLREESLPPLLSKDSLRVSLWTRFKPVSIAIPRARVTMPASNWFGLEVWQSQDKVVRFCHLF